jgi:hypothetical protein
MSASELERRRAYECRLTPDRALESLDEAAEWARDRGLITRTPDSALPSLHVACHEEPYAPDKPGFGQYPKTKWWWGGALAEQPDLRWLRIHRGTNVLVTDEVAALADPLARAELADADEGRYGDDGRRLVEHLAAAGPSYVEELKEELALDTRALRAAREPLERVAAVVARQVLVEAGSGEKYATELARWDQLFPESLAGRGLAELLVAGVHAAVLAPEDEARRWFAWPVASATVGELVEQGRVGRFERYLVSLASGS